MEPLLFDVGAKGLVVLGVATVAARFLKDGSAAARHLLWSIALASLAALPLLSVALPAWRPEVLPGGAVEAAATTAATAPVGEGVPWGRLAALAWLAGAVAVAAATALGRLRVTWLAHRSEPLESGPWPALANRVAGEIGLARRVRLRRVDREIMPMVWGVFRPVVLLPASAEAWDDSLKRHVLLHELAHVQRHDYPIQLVSRLALAIHWFDPLAWSAARRLRLERERACDDHVLGSGASACDYAEDLVEMARRLGPARRSALALGAVGPSNFADRVVALLDGGRPRRVLTRRIALGAGALAAGLVVPLAVLRPAARCVDPPVAVALAAETPPPGPSPAANARSTADAPRPAPATRAREAAPRPDPEERIHRPASPSARPAERAVQIVHVDPIEIVLPGPGSGAGALNAHRADARLTNVRIDKRNPTGSGEAPDHRAVAPTASDTCEEGERDAPSRPARLASTTPEATTP